VVVNPSYLIGPEDFGPSVMGRFFVRFWKGRIPLAPCGGLNLVDVRDVAVGHLLAAERGRAGQRYILCGENITFVDLQYRMAQVAGLEPRIIKTIPPWMEWLLAAGAELRARWRRREPYPCFQHVRLHRFTWFYDGQLARQELNFSARTLEESLRDTYLWHFGQDPLRLRGFQRFWMRPGE
jgi:dihydroflavonol-4-reductase